MRVKLDFRSALPELVKRASYLKNLLIMKNYLKGLSVNIVYLLLCYNRRSQQAELSCTVSSWLKDAPMTEWKLAYGCHSAMTIIATISL